jgi:hypothetical protein
MTVTHGTSQPPEQHSPVTLAPQPNAILSVPATVALCRSDYEQAADVRQTLAAQEARTR